LFGSGGVGLLGPAGSIGRSALPNAQSLISQLASGSAPVGSLGLRTLQSIPHSLFGSGGVGLLGTTGSIGRSALPNAQTLISQLASRSARAGSLGLGTVQLNSPQLISTSGVSSLGISPAGLLRTSGLPTVQKLLNQRLLQLAAPTLSHYY
jgi:hypothetical protein